MATTSIRIANAASGNRIQAIEAVETDGDGYSTVMERVVCGSTKVPSPVTVIRGAASPVSAADSLDLTALSSNITSNLLTVGDGCLLVVCCGMSVSNGFVVVTPLLFDGQSTPALVGILESKTFGINSLFRLGSTSGMYLAPLTWWDTRGAYKIGIHITALSSGNTCTVSGYII